MFKNAIKYLLLAAALMLAPSAASAAGSSAPLIRGDFGVITLEDQGLSVSSAYVQGVGIYQWNSASTATPEEPR